MLSLVKVQDDLKKYPDEVVAAYANGANPKDVPPFMASGEMLRRTQMRKEESAKMAAETQGATTTEQLKQEMMAGGQPTQRNMIEQAAGLMALQGSRQRQAAQQQQSAQRMAMMPAPNTTTSEPAQLAGGGYIDEIPRDYQAGGVAGRMDPAMLKKLMMLKAMKQKGISGLPISNDMFKRSDYAGGGIVAFSNGGAADVINAALEQGQQADEEMNMTPEQKQLMEVLRRIRGVKSLSEMKKEAGIGEAPDSQAERLRAFEEQQRRLGERDTVARRVMALNPRQLGRSMDEYLTRQETAEKDLATKMAELKDVRAKARYDASVGNVTAARAETLDALEKERNILKDISEVGYKSALRGQAEAGKTTDWTRRFNAYRPMVMQQLGITNPDDPRVSAATAQMVDESIGRAQEKVELGERSRVSGLETQAVKEFNDLFDPKKVLFGDLSDAIDEAKAKDKKEGTGTRYQDAVKLREYNQIRIGMGLRPTQTLPGGSTTSAPAASSKADPLGIRR
jgi:hypothetical protein